jgi:hypothetical protein
MSVVIADCLLPEGRRQAVTVQVADANCAPYEIRRSLAESLRVDPVLIRLTPSVGAQIEVPQRINCTILDSKSFSLSVQGLLALPHTEHHFMLLT